MTGGSKIAIMQPYFLPYIGYWQLINEVDKFVVYDNVQYTKKGWINRNRYLQNGVDKVFSLPLRKDSNGLDIKCRYLSEQVENEQKKILRRFRESYRQAPFYGDAMPVIEDCVLHESKNLFEYVHYSILRVCEYLNINTEVIKSSLIEANHNLKGEERVVDICRAMNVQSYVNPIGGLDLYDKDVFKQKGIQLSFIKSKKIEYIQNGDVFVPWLSIIDVIMFNEKNIVKKMLGEVEYK